MEEHKKGKLNDIRLKLLSGSTPSQLIKEGYAKSSVTYVDRKLKKEIAELEDSKENVPERLEKLEAKVLLLNKEIPDLVWKTYVSLYGVILRYQGLDDDKSEQEAIRTANDFLRYFGY